MPDTICRVAVRGKWPATWKAGIVRWLDNRSLSAILLHLMLSVIRRSQLARSAPTSMRDPLVSGSSQQTWAAADYEIALRRFHTVRWATPSSSAAWWQPIRTGMYEDELQPELQPLPLSSSPTAGASTDATTGMTPVRISSPPAGPMTGPDQYCKAEEHRRLTSISGRKTRRGCRCLGRCRPDSRHPRPRCCHRARDDDR